MQTLRFFESRSLRYVSAFARLVGGLRKLNANRKTTCNNNEPSFPSENSKAYLNVGSAFREYFRTTHRPSAENFRRVFPLHTLFAVTHATLSIFNILYSTLYRNEVPFVFSLSGR